ncbi:MAG TPA: hypothetical protein VJR89_18365, partial [Polyangiales bacterium]|nr:hypothetical protein [Polyangiales bacterium]
RLRGAQLYVPARPGLTAEWLSQRVQSELASAGSCRPSVPGVQVQVVSAGTGFWIVLSTGDERAAASLLAWAQRIVPAAR